MDKTPAHPHLRICQRNTCTDCSFREITQSSSFTKPSVIVFGGNNVTDDKSANGLAKRIEIILGRHETKDDDVQVFAATYPWKGQQMWDAILAYIAGKTGDPAPPPIPAKGRQCQRQHRNRAAPLCAQPASAPRGHEPQMARERKHLRRPQTPR